ncbi:MAG: DUF1015 domain-containing protein [Candidatus Brocadiaceae bacterium]|nr:DUF1015 domain-containing protein [Candidatus Brocadiaceae bacterium]
MFRFAAFRPLRYNPDEISFISRVVAPPYDVIDSQEARALREQDPHNVIRLILGREPEGGRPEGEYAAAAECLNAWRRAGVLIRDEEPSIYISEQTFTADDRQYVRTGILCALLLQDYSSDGVLPHENTFSGPKMDRYRLISACRAITSPVFGIFSDTDGQADALIAASTDGLPLYEFRDEADVAHRIWRVQDPAVIGRLAGLLAGERLLIADGHHRYETALRYSREHRSADGPPGTAPEDFTILFAVSIGNSGLVSQPTHRLVKVGDSFDAGAFLEQLREDFFVAEVAVRGPEGLLEAYREAADEAGWIGVYLSPARFLKLRPILADPLAASFPDQPAVWRALPVAILQNLLIEPLLSRPPAEAIRTGELGFTQKPEQVYWRVEGGRSDVGFLLPPISTRTVEEVARAGARMPQKSTYFWPKIPSGFVIYPHDDADCLPSLSPL